MINVGHSFHANTRHLHAYEKSVVSHKNISPDMGLDSERIVSSVFRCAYAMVAHAVLRSRSASTRGRSCQSSPEGTKAIDMIGMAGYGSYYVAYQLLTVQDAVLVRNVCGQEEGEKALL